MNTLYYGDNLPILREHIQDESIDLVCLDPPFNSNRSYNVLYRDESGQESDAQITAFEDTWHWNQAAEATYAELVTSGDRCRRLSRSFGRPSGRAPDTEQPTREALLLSDGWG